MKTAIVTDSTAYITKDIRDKLNIHMIPLNVIFGNETYREEIDITAEEFYRMVREKKELPTTSQPAVGEFVELFEKLKNEGYDAIISVHLSSGISGTYQGAATAGKMVEGIEVYPYDSEMSCGNQAFYAMEGAEMALAGKEPEEILERFEVIKKNSRAYFIVDDLTNLQRGGRLSKAEAVIGSLLQVKPVLHFEDKKIVPFEKIRTKKKAIKRINELLSEDVKDGKEYKAMIIHANRKEEANAWKEELEAKHPNVEFSIGYFGPVIGTHLGEGGLGITWVTK